MELAITLEAILFSAQKPLSPAELREILGLAGEQGGDGARELAKASSGKIEAALGELEALHEGAGRSYRLVCVAGAWQFVTRTEYAPWLKALTGGRARPTRLSHPALETLAIIAYRQPMTRAEIEEIRGVSVDGVMQTLLERGLVEVSGRAEVAGRPMTYGTTPMFLEYLGLKSLEDLPSADELRRIPVKRPEGLVTAGPGLATLPPEQLTLDEVSGSGSRGAGGAGAQEGAVGGAETASEGGERPPEA